MFQANAVSGNLLRLKTSLDTKTVSLLVLFFALLNKSLLAWMFTSLEGDKSLYLLMADSLLKGYGLLEPVTVAGTESTQFVYNPASISPLYSLLAVPILAITRSFLYTSVIIDIFSWLVLLSGIQRIGNAVLQSRWMANVLLIYCAFFIYPHQLESTPKDTLATGLICWSCLLCYRLCTAASFRPSLLISSVVVFVLLAASKLLYAALPVLFVLFVFGLAYQKNRRQGYVYAFSLTALLLVCFVGFYFFLNGQKDGAASITLHNDGTQLIKGFYPENLFRFFPFVSSSLINTNFWGVQIEQLSGIDFATTFRWFQGIDLICIFAVLCWAIMNRQMLKRWHLLPVVLFTTAASIVLMVVYASLRHKIFVYHFSGQAFTYVQEGRTFLFAILCIQVLLFYLLLRKKTMGLLKIPLILLLSFETLHGVYFSVKQAVRPQQHYMEAAGTRREVLQEFRRLEQKQSGLSLLTTDEQLRRLALVHHLPASSLPIPCDSSVFSSQSFLIAVLPADTALINSCIKRHHAPAYFSSPPYLLCFCSFNHSTLTPSIFDK